MSASTEKKNRRVARETGTDKKQLAAQAEAKKKAQSKRRWTIGTVSVAVLIVLLLLMGSSLLYTVPTALTVGGEKYTPAELNYYYANQYYTWTNNYGSYASLFGLDTSAGLTGLDAQECPMLEDGTWKDYFLEAAKQEIVETRALCDYAQANGIALTEEEIADVELSYEGLDEYVSALGYANVDGFFAANYGSGVTQKLVIELSLQSALANKAYNQASDSFFYSPSELEEYYQSLEGADDLFDFAYYYIAAETVETVDADGETVSEATEETVAAAEETAKAVLASYNDLAAAAEGGDIDYGALLDEAVAANTDSASATHPSSYSGSSLGAYKDFLMGDRTAGDADVVTNANGNGFYVVVFLNRDDNHYPLAQVRHILVMAEADEDGTYSDEAKEAAKVRAEEILQEWKDTEPTEEYFGVLAEVYSDDGGSNTNGGLYDHVYKGQMVEEFDAFCFEGHQPGDTGIVYGESSSYAGYHVMYYVGEGEQYSDYIARSALLSEDMVQWLSSLTEGYSPVTHFAIRYVG